MEGYQIEGFDWDTDAAFIASLERKAQADSRGLPCEDDCEVAAPYIGICPEESYQEHGSPLNFGQGWSDKEIDRQITEAMRMGLYDFDSFRKDVPTEEWGGHHGSFHFPNNPH